MAAATRARQNLRLEFAHNLKLATRTPDRIAFDSADAGKLANYLLRWVNTKGEHGPWSQVISATIPAV